MNLHTKKEYFSIKQENKLLRTTPSQISPSHHHLSHPLKCLNQHQQTLETNSIVKNAKEILMKWTILQFTWHFTMELVKVTDNHGNCLPTTLKDITGINSILLNY